MKLTPLAKLFVSVLILGTVGYIGYVKLPPGTLPFGKKADQPQKGDATTLEDPSETKGQEPTKGSKDRIVVGVNDFGGAYPLILANDGAKPGPDSRFKKAGLDVEIKLIRGSKERLKAFDEGEVHVMLLTLDYLANLVPVYKQKGVDLRSFLLVDWSRGNVGIVAKPAFTSIESLKKARVATTRNTPTHYLLLSLLDKSNLSPPDIDEVKSRLVFATKTPEAGEMFQRDEVDAVAIWEPHLSQAASLGKGNILVTTETATNLIADVLYAKKEWIKAHEEQIPLFSQAFFDAVKDLDQDEKRAVSLSAKAFKQKEEEIASTLKKIKPATYADNRDFFGLSKEECAYDRLYMEATRFWQKEGLIKGDAEEPRATRYVKGLEALADKHKGEAVVERFQFTAAPDPKDTKGSSLLTKSISIYFGSGQSSLDPNARKVLDGFADTLQVFQNAYVRIEGNTDNVGNRQKNIVLSQARADAVVEYLVSRHRLDRARFVAVGNGPDAAVADNKTDAGRELNRRTDFKIIKNSEALSTPVGDLIRSAIASRLQEVRKCYEAGLRKRPGLRGRVVVQMKVTGSGLVEDASVASTTLSDKGIEGCIIESARTWKMGALPSGEAIVIKYPFVLESN